mmetsp:Transcript_14457/g.35008  ORF Transcript_14457/g.35008 Transcript_14457/m.35008 type:complete len:112 (+) Transcript_14457:8469-8804(+)
MTFNLYPDPRIRRRIRTDSAFISKALKVFNGTSLFKIATTSSSLDLHLKSLAGTCIFSTDPEFFWDQASRLLEHSDVPEISSYKTSTQRRNTAAQVLSKSLEVLPSLPLVL